MPDRFPLETAAAYAALSLRVIPICSPDHECQAPGKAPFDSALGQHLGSWQTRGVPDPDELDRWLTSPSAPHLNIGLVLGGGLVGLDIDGEDGDRILAARSGGNLPPTWEFTTARGRRLLYALPRGVRIAKTSFRGETRNGLDILGDGAQSVLPPSLHATGSRYRWAPGRDPWQAGTPAPAPAWLRALSRVGASSRQAQTSARAGWWDPLLRGVPVGARHIAACRLVGRWVRLGLTPSEIMLLIAAWNGRNAEPLPDIELERMVGDLTKRAPPDRGQRVIASG